MIMLEVTTRNNSKKEAVVGVSGVVSVSERELAVCISCHVVSHSSLFVLFHTGNLSQRGGMRASKLQQRNVENDGTKEESKKPAAVLGDVKEKPVGEEIEEDTTPQLKDEDDVDDGDRKPAAKATGAPKEETVVVVVTMDEAKYSTDRMIKALVSTWSVSCIDVLRYVCESLI